MKKISMILMAAAILFVSCKEDNDVVPEIKSDVTELLIPVEGCTDAPKTVAFSTNTSWTAAADAAWIQISPASGKSGDCQLSVSVGTYYETVERSGKIVITAGETATHEISVTQYGVPFMEVEATEAAFAVAGGDQTIAVRTNSDYTVSVSEDSEWLTAEKTDAGVKLTAAQNETFDAREAEVTIAPANEALEAQTITVSQAGKAELQWVKKPATDWTSFDATKQTKFAVLGDYLLVANGSKGFAVNAADGTVAQTIDMPTGVVAENLAVDTDGNIIVAANAAWSSDASAAEMFNIYSVKSLTDFSKPTVLVSYSAGNIWCDKMANVRVAGSTSGNGIITAFAGYSAYWMAWDVKNGEVQELKYNTTPYTANHNCGCVYPAGTSLADGLWFIGYGGDYNLRYCADPANPSWVTAYETVGTWMEDYNAISIATVGGKKYMAILQGCFFNYDNTEVLILDVTDPANVSLYYELKCELQASRSDAWANLDWTGGTSNSDVCLVAKDGTLYVYYVDAAFGVAGCLKLAI